MQPETLEIRPDIRAGLHSLAEETHRDETDMLNEALAVFLERERPTRIRGLSESRQSTQALIDRIKSQRAVRDISGLDIREAIEEGRD